MGELADPRVFELVRALCASFPSFKEEAQKEDVACFPTFRDEAQEDATCFSTFRGGAQEDEACFEMVQEAEMDPSVSYDKVLAELLDMGYEIELASRAILDCGRLDVVAVIDHMNSEAPPSLAMESSVLPSTYIKSADSNLSLSSTNVEVKEENAFNSGSGLTYPRAASLEAGTSRAHSSVKDQDELNDLEDVGLCTRSLRSSSTSKGKLPMSTTVEDEAYDDDGDKDRWQQDELPEADNETYLLGMGFSVKDVTDAIEACGSNGDVNRLVTHIINNIVDLPESNWEDCDLVDDDMVDVDYQKRAKKEDLAIRELSDRGHSILSKLRRMGYSFTAKMVVEAIQACGKDADEEVLVDYLLRIDERSLRGDSNGEAQHLTKLEQLQWLGCTSTAACLRAIDNNCDADLDELLDYYYAEELQDREDDPRTRLKKRRRKENSVSTKVSKLLQRKPKKLEYYEEDEPEEYLPKFHRNMKGFGLPGEPVIPRVLSEDISRPPYFYFENVAYTPKHEWSNIQRHLYNIEPEFIDSLNFSPCRRPRGYIHNLPVEGRVDILPKLPMSVQELIPGAAGFWPAWDERIKLNTINTRAASEFVRRQIQENLEAMETGNPSSRDIKTIMYWAKKWNLVWIKPGVLAPLTPDEIETCLGFDVSHTRVLYSPTDRVRVLGNSFQVTTVAYHLSVLRPIYRNGIRVLSLFSGIGGAEVALHKLGIFLKLVVSVEIDDKARMVVDSWWKTTNQKGTLIHTFTDVKEVDSRAIQGLVDEFGGFDLVIGGSPCNNLSGNNRCSRTGLAGPASVTFFEFPRILAEVRDYMGQKRR
ncbi:unnamed protein product [Calypogeia fissa]